MFQHLLRASSPMPKGGLPQRWVRSIPVRDAIACNRHLLLPAALHRDCGFDTQAGIP